MFISEDPGQPIKLDATNISSVAEAPVIIDAPIKFLLHGYTGHVNYSPNMELRPGKDNISFIAFRGTNDNNNNNTRRSCSCSFNNLDLHTNMNRLQSIMQMI